MSVLERTPCSTMLKTISPKSSAPRSRPTAGCEKKSSKNDVQKCPPNAAGAGRKIKDKNQACKKPTTTKPYKPPSLPRSVINHLLRSLIQKRAGIPSIMNPSLNRNPLIVLELGATIGTTPIGSVRTRILRQGYRKLPRLLELATRRVRSPR